MIKKRYVLLGVFVYCLGFVDGKYQSFLYGTIKSVYESTGLPVPGRRTISKIPVKYNNIHTEKEIKGFIRVHSHNDVISFRKKMIGIVFGESAEILNPKFRDNNEEKIGSLTNLPETNYRGNVVKKTMTINMEHGINSIVDVYIPHNHNSRLLIYYHGHPGSYIEGNMKVVDYFLDKDFIVMAVNMPLQGDNPQPSVYVNNVGKVKFSSHDHFKFLDNPLSYFIYPVMKSLDILSETLEVDDYSILGLSGGASMATLISAIDTRILKTYAVSTQYPLFLTNNQDQDYGDFESTYPKIIKNIGYLNVYILASVGSDRKYTQIFNLYDGDYSGGLKFEAYDKIIEAHVSSLGKGSFKVISEDIIGHRIADRTLDFIYSDLTSH